MNSSSRPFPAPPPEVSIDDAPRVEVRSREEWRRWLEEHHDTSPGIWLVTWKKQHADRYVSWPDIVKEAICFGWIDGRSRRVDDDRTSIYVTRRRPGSPWSRLNKGYVEELESQGSIMPAGKDRIERAKLDGSWSFLDDIEALVEPADLVAALEASPPARSRWAKLSASARKRFLYDIKTARRPDTRRRRIAQVVAKCMEREENV